MTLVGTLWGNVHQPLTKAILSVAAVNGFELEQPQWSYTNKPAEFTAKFGYGKVPAFEGTDGFKLIEGTTIARYLSSIGTKVSLLGSNAQETAIVDQWVHFVEHELGGPIMNIMGLIYGFNGPFNLETLNKITERLTRGLVHLEAHLAARPSGYVALDTLTLADFVLASVISGATRASLGSAERAQYPYIFAHYAKVTADERLKQYWGTEDFVDVRITEAKTYTHS